MHSISFEMKVSMIMSLLSLTLLHVLCTKNLDLDFSLEGYVFTIMTPWLETLDTNLAKIVQLINFWDTRKKLCN